MTKGSGGQIAQLRNIEHIQTEQTATSKACHASHLEMATANELLNPLALVKSKPKPHVKMSSASSLRVYKSPLTSMGCLCPHIKQLLAVLDMAFALQSQTSNMEKMMSPQLLHLVLVSGAPSRLQSYSVASMMPVMMAFVLKVSSIRKAVAVLMLLSTRYLLMKKIEQLRVWFKTISNKLKNITIETISLMLQILNIYIMFINSSSLIAQLHSNKMCCWMNIHLQLLPNKFQLLCGAASDPFPSRAWFVDEKSALYITEAMAEHEQMGMLIPCGYWPDYHKDLGILLWEALMTWQSTLKAKACEYVLQAAIDNIYSKVFVQLMAMQTKIDGNHKHAAMTQMLRIGWATTGSASLGGKMTIASEDDFEVVLD
ncbi:hypothetical protein EDC04DRAFT_2609881 [Pisolithus marmoratus]|nr:hypothetical protein EDC04DRAFT_2609881 [Pisolithus marmoratus]